MNAPQAIVLTITASPDGRVDVTSPIGNKILCYGLLEIARQTVEKHTVEMPKVHLPSIGLAR